MSKQKKILLTVILSFFLILSLVKIILFIEQVSRQSLQMDFTAYYTAGKVMNLGLNPYKNYITQDWLLWDGVAQFNHSRFLYPPIAGNFFQPIAKLPYETAKHIWNYLNLFFILAAIFLWISIFNFRKNLIIILCCYILSLNFFPVYTLLERGQIDGLTFFLISLSVFFSYKKRNSILSGLSIVFASFFKFYSLILVPFLLIKRKYKTALSVISFFAVFMIIMYFTNGTKQVNDYIFNEAPRISQFGESGTDDMRPESWILKNYFRISRYSISMIEGRTYVSESISFFSNASLVRLIALGQTVIGLNIAASIWSVLFFIPAFYFLYRRRKVYSSVQQWILILLLILIFSPFTWVMNLIWLIPVFLLLIQLIKEKRYKNLSFIFIAIGMLIIFVPDNHRTYISIVDSIIKHRHIAGEIFILTGMILLPKFAPSKISASEPLKSSSISI